MKTRNSNIDGSNINSDRLSDDLLHRYARQLILPNFEDEHQLMLGQAHAVIIGAGGLGAPVLQYLASAGVGHISIVDDDIVEMTNLNRQVIHGEDNLGQTKTTSAASAITAINSNTVVICHASRFTDSNADILLAKASIIIDASDNPETRMAANRAAHRNAIPLVFGGAVRLEGQVASFRSGIDHGAPCYQCLFPKPVPKELAAGCSEAGILGPITGIIGSMMALEAIKQILIPADILGETQTGKLMLYDGFNLMATVISIKKQRDCPVCGAKS